MSEITSSIGMLDRMMEQDYQMENTIYLATEIDRNSQVLFCRQLRKLAERELKKKEKDRKPIKIRISSCGGWVCSVFAMISTMEEIKEKGIVIETYCDGYTASGGSKILIAGTKGHRFMSRYGTVLLHQPNGFKCGNSTLKEDYEEVRETMKSWETICDIFRKYTKLTDQDIENFTEKNINFTYRPKECLEKGLVDKIL